MKVLEDRVEFLVDQLVERDKLYERWPHATMDEIVELCNNKSLRTYQHLKGPIKGILYCIHTSGIIYRNSFANDDCYYDDDHISYFLLEDVKRCEEKYPDFLGNPANGTENPFADFTPPDLQADIPIEQIRKELGMSRIDCVDFLNYDYEGRLVTSHEEAFRDLKERGGYRGGIVPYFTLKDLDEVTVERIDWENWKSRHKGGQSGAQGKEPAAEHSHYDSDVQGRVAELKSFFDGVRAERDNASEALKEANARIAELEAAGVGSEATPRTQVGLDKKKENDLNSWKQAFGAMINVAIQCVKEERNQVTKAELEELFQKELSTITPTQLKFFRENMPKEYINRGGEYWSRKATKKTPS